MGGLVFEKPFSISQQWVPCPNRTTSNMTLAWLAATVSVGFLASPFRKAVVNLQDTVPLEGWGAVDGRNPAPLWSHGQPLLVGMYSGILRNQGVLGAKRMSHPSTARGESIQYAPWTISHLRHPGVHPLQKSPPQHVGVHPPQNEKCIGYDPWPTCQRCDRERQRAAGFGPFRTPQNFLGVLKG